MKIGKVLRNTALASAVAVVAFGAASAFAYSPVLTSSLNGGVFAAHVGASVLGTTAMTENNAVSFGNIAVSGPGTMTMDTAGARVAASGITALDGGNNGSTLLDDTYSAAAPGTYTITGPSGASVYVTYFVTGGGGNKVGTSQATNSIDLTNGTDHLYVYSLVDTGTAITAGDEYAQNANSVVDLTGGTATLKIGGTIEAIKVGGVSDGAYRGTFDIMLHY